MDSQSDFVSTDSEIIFLMKPTSPPNSVPSSSFVMVMLFGLWRLKSGTCFEIVCIRIKGGLHTKNNVPGLLVIADINSDGKIVLASGFFIILLHSEDCFF